MRAYEDEGLRGGGQEHEARGGRGRGGKPAWDSGGGDENRDERHAQPEEEPANDWLSSLRAETAARVPARPARTGRSSRAASPPRSGRARLSAAGTRAGPRRTSGPSTCPAQPSGGLWAAISAGWLASTTRPALGGVLSYVAPREHAAADCSTPVRTPDHQQPIAANGRQRPPTAGQPIAAIGSQPSAANHQQTTISSQPQPTAASRSHQSIDYSAVAPQATPRRAR